MTEARDVGVERHGHVAVIEIRRPPLNHFDLELIVALADVFEEMDRDDSVRAIVLASQGTAFCSGANLASTSKIPGGPYQIYTAAARMFAVRKPIVGAIQGPATGGGLGLALVPDFRIAAPEARFAAHFVKLGYHPGFGLTYTLPQLIGRQKAALLFYTGRRIDGAQALDWGLVDELVPLEKVRDAALALAAEIAEAAPLAVVATRATFRGNFVDTFLAQAAVEAVNQAKLRTTQDYEEGLRASAERRTANFIGG